MMLFEQLAGEPGGQGDVHGVSHHYAQAMDLSNAAPIPPEIVLEARLGALGDLGGGGVLARDCAFKFSGAHGDRRISACAMHVGRTSERALPVRLGCAEAVLEHAATFGADNAPRLAVLECDDAPWQHYRALARADFAEFLLIVDCGADLPTQLSNLTLGREESARTTRRPPAWILCFGDQDGRAASSNGRARASALLRGLLPTVDGVYLLPLLLAAPGTVEGPSSGTEQLAVAFTEILAKAGLRRAAPGLWMASSRLHRSTGAPLLTRLLACQSQGDYVGIGPLAVSRIDRVRFRNWAEPGAYRHGVRACGHGIAQSWSPSAYEAFVAELLAALALGESVDVRSLATRHQLARPLLLEELRRCFARLAELGAVAWRGPLTVTVPAVADALFGRIVTALGALRGRVGVVALHSV